MGWKDEILKFNEKFGTNEENVKTALEIINESIDGFRKILRDEKVPNEVKDQLMTPMLELHRATKYLDTVHLDLKYGELRND